MAVQKSKRSHARKNVRRSTMFLKISQYKKCLKCNKILNLHFNCDKCAWKDSNSQPSDS